MAVLLLVLWLEAGLSPAGLVPAGGGSWSQAFPAPIWGAWEAKRKPRGLTTESSSGPRPPASSLLSARISESSCILYIMRGGFHSDRED